MMSTFIFFIYELDPYSLEIYRMYVKAFKSYRLTYRQTDRQTDSTEIIKYAASRVVKNQSAKRSAHLCPRSVSA